MITAAEIENSGDRRNTSSLPSGGGSPITVSGPIMVLDHKKKRATPVTSKVKSNAQSNPASA